MSPDYAFDCLRRIGQEVPGISYLLGLRSAGLGPVAEGAGPVAADDPNFRMVSQPGREGRRGPISQDDDGAVCSHVDEDRCVGPSPSNGELVDAEDAAPALMREAEEPGSAEAECPCRCRWQSAGTGE
nr:hypothetical protein [Streptomyces virginiae]